MEMYGWELGVLEGFTPEGRLRNGAGADCGDCG